MKQYLYIALILFLVAIIAALFFSCAPVWNIPAHSRDIIESEFAGNLDGYYLAGATGFGGNVFMQGKERGRDAAV